VQIGKIGKKIKYFVVLTMGQMVFIIGQTGKSGEFAGGCWLPGRVMHFLGSFLLFVKFF